MNLTPIKSTNLKAMTHSPATGALRMQLSTGQTYDYAGVDVEAFQKLASAKSVGGHFAQHIRTKHLGKEIK